MLGWLRVLEVTRFLSTLSLRRATSALAPEQNTTQHFYPRSPCGERRPSMTVLHCKTLISIHALLAESDSWDNGKVKQSNYFYPRSPCGERPASIAKTSNADTFLSTLSLRRATTQDATPVCAGFQFLSTLSLRRATKAQTFEIAPLSISIHALLAESDDMSGATGLIFRAFLSTLSLRRATERSK